MGAEKRELSSSPRLAVRLPARPEGKRRSALLHCFLLPFSVQLFWFFLISVLPSSSEFNVMERILQINSENRSLPGAFREIQRCP